MILADFSQIQNQRKEQNKDNKSQGGVKGNQKNSQASKSRLNLQEQNNIFRKERSIYQYIHQLGIQNVGQLYYRQEEDKVKKQKQLQKSIANQIFKSTIDRLYHGKSTKKGVNQQSQQAAQICSEPQQNLVNKKQKKQQSNGYNHNDSEGQEQNQQSHQVHYYNQLYEQQKNYQLKFQVRNLQIKYKKNFEKLRSIIQKKVNQEEKKSNKHTNKNKNNTKSQKQKQEQKIKQLNELTNKTIVIFMLQCELFSNKKPNTLKIFKNQDKMFTQFNDFINKTNIKNLRQRSLTSILLDQQLIQQLSYLSSKQLFFYQFLNFNQLQLLLQQQGNKKIKNMQNILKMINQTYEKDKNWSVIYEKFSNSIQTNNITVPFQTKLYEVKKSSINNQNQFNANQQDLQNIQLFKANPIPQSTYSRPKQRPQSSKKTSTIPSPFNFSQTHQNVPKISADDLYNWNRNFKAKSTPKTTYKAPQSQKLKQKQILKKYHQQTLLKTSEFPKTMKYLENIIQYKDLKKRQLYEKYVKKQDIEQDLKPKQIPNFQVLHRKQLHQLEIRKQLNKTNTKPIPFKFSQTSKSQLKSLNKNTLLINQQLNYSINNLQNGRKKRSTKDSSIPQARSTAKFDSYVNLRRQQRQQKKKNRQQDEKYKKRKQQDMKQYKQILKQRMHYELLNQPKARQYGQANTINNNALIQNMLKVNLQDIYMKKPLLMENLQTNDKKGNKNNKNNNKKGDDEKTCFTDLFEPII